MYKDSDNIAANITNNTKAPLTSPSTADRRIQPTTAKRHVNQPAVQHTPRRTRPRTGPTFNVGDRVRAIYHAFAGRQAKFDGSIIAVNDDNTCDIQYDDDDIERGVLKENIFEPTLARLLDDSPDL